MLQFMSDLVRRDWFTKVKMVFLKAGHTHGEVDRDLFQPLGMLLFYRACYFFSVVDNCRFSRCILFLDLGQKYRQKSSCLTADDLPRWIEGGFRYHKGHKPTIGSSELYKWNWKDYYAPHCVSLANFTKYRAFKMVKVNGVVELFYKKSVLDEKWMTYKEGIFVFFSTMFLLFLFVLFSFFLQSFSFLFLLFFAYFLFYSFSFFS
jgi:hypothetical protein